MRALTRTCAAALLLLAGCGSAIQHRSPYESADLSPQPSLSPRELEYAKYREEAEQVQARSVERDLQRWKEVEATPRAAVVNISEARDWIPPGLTREEWLRWRDRVSYSDDAGLTFPSVNYGGTLSSISGQAPPALSDPFGPGAGFDAFGPHVAENGDIYNEDNDADGRREPIHVNGHMREGRWVRGHYRARER